MRRGLNAKEQQGAEVRILPGFENVHASKMGSYFVKKKVFIYFVPERPCDRSGRGQQCWISFDSSEDYLLLFLPPVKIYNIT